MFTPSTFATLPKPKQYLVLSSLFFAVNWFRELVNAFVTQKDATLKIKVREGEVLRYVLGG